jgi:class 3 adenylate cyclase
MGAHVGDAVVARGPAGYEIFGDAVRVAKRLEQSGEGGRIHVSRAFADAVRRSFRLEEQTTDTYWLSRS